MDDDGTYRPRPLSSSPDGTLWAHSAVLGLDVCARPDLTLQLYDPVGGQWFITPEEVVASGRVAAANLEAAETARQAAESARQAAEVARQEEATARQIAEAARQATEEENRRLLEQLRRLQSNP